MPMKCRNSSIELYRVFLMLGLVLLHVIDQGGLVMERVISGRYFDHA